MLEEKKEPGEAIKLLLGPTLDISMDCMETVMRGGPLPEITVEHKPLLGADYWYPEGSWGAQCIELGKRINEVRDAVWAELPWLTRIMARLYMWLDRVIHRVPID